MNISNNNNLNITITLYAGCSLTRLIVKWLFNLNPQVNIKDRKFVAGIVALTSHCSLIPYTNHPFYIWICNINLALEVLNPQLSIFRPPNLRRLIVASIDNGFATDMVNRMGVLICTRAVPCIDDNHDCRWSTATICGFNREELNPEISPKN